MFTRLLAILSVLLGAAPAWAAPQVTSGKSPASTLSTTVTFKISDTSDSEAIPVSGFCSVRYQQAGGDDASLYAVPTAATAATSGTLIGTFTSSTTTATTFTAGTRWVKAVATDATVGGSVMVIDCSPLTGGGGGGGTFSVTSYGATGNGTTNDRVAINLAVDAACDAGGGVVYFPPGTYAVGTTGANRFYSGIQVTCSNVILLGVPNASVIVPLFTHGGSLLNVCPAFDNSVAYGGDEDCDSAANISNVRIEGLKFYDADARDTCNGYSAATGTCSSEETHAIFISECDDCVVTGNIVDSLGDEGIVFASLSGGGGRVEGNFIRNTPSIRGSAGSSIEVEGSNVIVTNNTIEDLSRDPFSDGGSCTTLCNNIGSAIMLSTSALTATTDVVVSNNLMRNIGADAGILVYANGAAVADITIEGNQIDMDDTDTIGCVETPVYPGTPARCAIAIGGSAGSPTRDRIVVEGNIANSGMVSSNVDNVRSVSFIGNTLSGDEGRGIQAAGRPLVIAGNTIKDFQASGLFIAGLEDDDRTDSVLIQGNSLIGNNDDATAEEGILFYDPDTTPANANCGTDAVVPGGVVVEGNTFKASATASSLTFVVRMDNCVRGKVSNNIIDSLSAGTANNTGIYGGAIITGNKIMNSAGRGIYTDANNVVIADNLIETTGFSGIQSAEGNLTSILGNTVITAISPAIDASGEQPTCLGNTSISTTAADRTIVCGEGGTGVGCTADTAANGICDDNQVCNTGDAAC